MTLSHLTTGGWIYFAVWCAIVPVLLWPRLRWAADNSCHFDTTVLGVAVSGLMTAYLLWLVTP
jgi:hypothetical protein